VLFRSSNMPKAPKPMVRKFADGGSVRTRSDDEIGDTNPRTGVVDPGSYDRRMQAGEENMARLKSAAESIRSFFSRDKSGEASPSNITGDSGMSESDTAKKQAMSGGMTYEKKSEPMTEEPSYKQDVVKAITQPKATVQESTPSAETMPAEKAKPVSAKPAKVTPPTATTVNGKTFSEDMADRKKAAQATTSPDSMLYSSTIKSTPAPAAKKPRVHPRTGRPY